MLWHAMWGSTCTKKHITLFKMTMTMTMTIMDLIFRRFVFWKRFKRACVSHVLLVDDLGRYG